MKKRVLAALLGICMLVGVTGCGEKETKPIYSASQAEQDYQEPEQETPTGSESGGASEEISVEMLREGINSFAYDMYEELGGQEDIFFSPYSLCTALSLLDTGAGSETKEELEKLLGITDLDTWNREMRAYLEKQWSDDTFVITANSIWLDRGKTFAENVETDFLQPAGYYYKSELYEVDFRGNPDAAVKQMNNWAEQNTKGMIPQIINEIPVDTAMVLMNAVYFEGKWEIPFAEDNTFEETFHGTDGDSQVDMMHQYGNSYAYVESSGMKGIALPYKDENVVMKVFIPREEDGDIAALFSALSFEEKEELLNSLDNGEKVEISRLALPKFTMEKSIDGLNDILQAMGMESAFDPLIADFDKISGDLYVSEVLHKAKIEVDEEGTKAAAVTAIVTCDTAAVIEKEIIEFVADRPFIYVLQDTETGMILFMGRANNL